MKKVFAVLAVSAFLFACNSGAESTESTEAPATEQAAPEAPAAPATDSAATVAPADSAATAAPAAAPEAGK